MKTEKLTKPPKPVIIYDGECNFCINSIRRIRRKAHANQFVYTPRQTPDLHAMYPQLVAEESKTGMRFIDPNGSVFCGADAVYQIYRRLGRYRYITWVYRVPVVHALLKGMYFIIAKNRFRFGRTDCESGTCSIE